jgi:aminocarboxymuconate-semialdehyde decarboxylase
MAQRTVDVHNHWYPPEYLEYLTTRSEPPYAKQTGETSYLCYAARDVIVAHIDRPGHYDLDARIADLDKAGMDTQVMSITIPGPELLPEDEGIYWAKKINDAYAGAARDYPGRFYAMAALPYQVPDEAVKELERCKTELGVKGVQVFSNIKGEPLFLDKYDTLFAQMEEWDLPFLLHPTVPWTSELMDMLRIPYQLYGYTIDTSVSMISLIFHGLFDKYPNLKAIHAHLGGVVPHLVRRLQDSWKGYRKEWDLELDEAPDVQYQKHVWPDMTSFYKPAMKATLEWVGPTHMVIGTDYAHRVGDPEGAIASVKEVASEMNLNDDERDLIMGKTAETIFNLEPMKE